MDRAFLQDLLAATVAALKEEIPGLGEVVAFDVKHIYAWVVRRFGAYEIPLRRAERLRVMTSRTMPYLEGKPKEDSSMALKRLNLKVWKVTRRKSCAHGEAGIAEPKFPTVQAYAHRSIPEAVTP